VPASLALIIAIPVVAFMVLTGMGESQRGARPLTVVVAALFFPITWMVWYVRDEHPYAGSRPRQSA
jgi:hypothetical protein